MCWQARLLQLYDATEGVRRQRAGDELVLAMNRSDYMLDEPSGSLLQVRTCQPVFQASGLQPSVRQSVMQSQWQ